MENSFTVLPATLDFGRSDFAVIRGRVSRSPLSLGAVPIQAKTSSSRIPLASTTKQRSVFTGFFASIVAGLTGQGKGQRLNLKAHCGDKSLQQRTNPSKIAGSTRKAVGSVAPKGIL